MQGSQAKCKKCKRVSNKLFLKGERCSSSKCPLVRGTDTKSRGRSGGGPRRRRKNVSEYGLQLREKQKVKFGYGLREKQFKNYAKEASKKSGSGIPERFFALLESRLDNVVFRLGFTSSRTVSRQMVSHGHIMVNGRKVDIPSYRTKVGDKISIRPQSTEKGIFKDIDDRIKKYEVPSWLKLDKAKKEGEVTGIAPLKENIGVEVSLSSILEFYNR